MRFVLLGLAVVLGLSPYIAEARTEAVVTTVADVIEPEDSGHKWIFLLSTGRTLRVPAADRPNLELLRAYVRQPRFLRIEFTDYGSVDHIESILEMPQIHTTDASEGFPIEPQIAVDDRALGRIDYKFEGYDLTPLGIFSFFKSFRLPRSSQCFHRAYYWAHQLWRQTGALSQKVFLFFTRKYVNRYNYHWWFHVSPYVYGPNGEELVVDATYLKGPVSMKQWSDYFMRNDPVCPTVSNFVGYRAHAQAEWCYFVKVPMYYYHPSTLEAVGAGGENPKTWKKNWLGLARQARRGI